MKSKTIPETVRISLGALACLALLAACSGKPGPSKSELEAELISGQLPASWSLESLDVTAQENIGTDVEPVVASRFAAEIELQQDLYKQTVTSRPVEAEGGNKVRYLADHRIVEQATEAGTEAKLFGVARSTRRGEGWNIRIELESRPWSSAGEPLSEFGTEYVIAGSDEEAALIERVNAEWRAEQRRQEEEERRRLAEMERLNDVTLERFSTGFAELSADDSGAIVEAVAEFDPPSEAGSRFDFNVFFEGRMYTYYAVVRNGGILGGDPDGSCQFMLAPEDEDGRMVGVSECSLMPGDLSFETTTEDRLAVKYAEEDRRLMAFFQAAASGSAMTFRHRNLTFGGSDTYGLEVDRIEDGLIYVDILNRGQPAGSTVWYVKYGKVRPKSQESAWWYLEYASPIKLEGRRYTSRPNRPIGMTLERAG
jgi:hypothetical protein